MFFLSVTFGWFPFFWSREHVTFRWFKRRFSPASRTATCFIPIVSSSQNPSFVIDVALAKNHTNLLCVTFACVEQKERVGWEHKRRVFVFEKKTPDFDRKKIKVLKKAERTYRIDTETLRALATPRSSVQRGCNTKTFLRSSSSPLVELSVYFCVSEYFFLF